MYEIANPDDPRYHALQLHPLKGGRYKTVLYGPEGTDIGDLHCDLEPYVEGDRPAIVSHSGWMPSEEHVKMMAAGAHVRLGVFQHPIPPLAVSIEPPVCSCHDMPMDWHGDDGGFYCSQMPTLGEDNSDGFDAAKREFNSVPDEGDLEAD